jgi:hypothetical protein
MAATSERGENNRQRHQRTKQEAGTTSGNRETRILWRSRTKHRAEDREANSQVFREDSKNEC